MAVPVLVLFAGAIVDLGIILSTSIRLENAVEAGALYGRQSNSFATDAVGIVDVVSQDAGNVRGLTVATRRYCRCPSNVAGTTEGGDVACTTTCITGAYGAPRVYVEVTATGTAGVVFFPSLLSSASTMTRTASFRSQ